LPTCQVGERSSQLMYISSEIELNSPVQDQLLGILAAEEKPELEVSPLFTCTAEEGVNLFLYGKVCRALNSLLLHYRYSRKSLKVEIFTST
jgi:hypothetical protein